MLERIRRYTKWLKYTEHGNKAMWDLGHGFDCSGREEEEQSCDH
jgi:hypothetical protein